MIKHSQENYGDYGIMHEQNSCQFKWQFEAGH